MHHFGELGKAGSFIVMEHLNFGGRASGAELGRQLAAMHLATPTDPDAAAGRFGFPVANTCGATPQVNDWSDDWVAFYRDQRLRYQLQLTGNAELQRMGDKLCANIHTFFDGITVRCPAGRASQPHSGTYRNSRPGLTAPVCLVPTNELGCLASGAIVYRYVTKTTFLFFCLGGSE